MLLSGNVHFAEVSRWDDGPYPPYDFTSSGITHVNPKYASVANPYRVAGPYVSLNFGLVEVNWEAEPSPAVTLKAIGSDGSVAFEQQISLASLSSARF